MNARLRAVVTVVALGTLAPSAVFAGLREVEKGVFVEDFEDETLY